MSLAKSTLTLGGSKITYLRKVYFDQLLDFPTLLLLFLHAINVPYLTL